jgi:prepilin signal peptidase PulO-like enzyme (type II secretory pathway)
LCTRQLAWFENIPLVSYLFLKGKCRTCLGKIPGYYFWTELSVGLLFIFIFWVHGGYVFQNLIDLVFQLVIASILVFIFLYDILYKEILPETIWLGLFITIIYYLFFNTPNYLSVFYGTLFGFGFFALQYFVSKGRWIGGGDVRLGLFLGLLLGWQLAVVALLSSYWAGAIVGVSLIIAKKSKMNSEIPFGTFLVVGTLIAMYWGENIIRWYGSFIN